MNIKDTVRMNQNFTRSDFEFHKKFIFKDVTYADWNKICEFYADKRTFTVLDTNYNQILIRDTFTGIDYCASTFGFVVV